MWSPLRQAKYGGLCPWCGESDTGNASTQIEETGRDRWFCNTCSKVFTMTVSADTGEGKAARVNREESA